MEGERRQREKEKVREAMEWAERDRRARGCSCSGQASGRSSVPYLLSLLPVLLHGRTEVLGPVCLPWLDL